MILRSKSLGEIEVRDDAAIHLPDGLLGFEDLRKFVFLDVEEFRPFLWLISTDEPEIGFAVADPRYFYAGSYEIPLSEADRDILDCEPNDRLSVFVLVSVPESGGKITANLKGPVVMNARNRLAKQVVVYNPAFAVRQPMLLPSSITSAALQAGNLQAGNLQAGNLQAESGRGNKMHGGALRGGSFQPGVIQGNTVKGETQTHVTAGQPPALRISVG